MTTKSPRHLTLVKTGPSIAVSTASTDRQATSIVSDVDWSILMAHSQAGDRSSYLRLLEQITPYLRGLARKSHSNTSDVEDAVQDILLTLHAVRATYNPARPFGPWLLAIANRRIIDGLRRQGRRRLRETVLTAEHDAMPVTRDEESENINDHQLKMAISGLSPPQRQAIELLKLKEMTLKEAAKTTGLSISNLKITTHRALNSLRKILHHKDKS
jgi:RNA polymerase sigma factor (sigma-70 family)